VVCDRNNQKGIEKLSEIVERIWPTGDHLLSKSLFSFENGEWVKLRDA